MKIYDEQGQRLYLTSNEREDFIEVAKNAPREIRTFCFVLHYTGCRISEALSLTPKLVDFSEKALVFKTLKKRGRIVHRGVPLNTLSKWLGHSSLETTAIYANALGEEQRDIASRMWT